MDWLHVVISGIATVAFLLVGYFNLRPSQRAISPYWEMTALSCLMIFFAIGGILWVWGTFPTGSAPWVMLIGMPAVIGDVWCRVSVGQRSWVSRDYQRSLIVGFVVTVLAQIAWLDPFGVVSCLLGGGLAYCLSERARRHENLVVETRGRQPRAARKTAPRPVGKPVGKPVEMEPLPPLEPYEVRNAHRMAEARERHRNPPINPNKSQASREARKKNAKKRKRQKRKSGRR